MTVRASRPPGSRTNSTATAPAQTAPRTYTVAARLHDAGLAVHAARAGRRVEEVMAR